MKRFIAILLVGLAAGQAMAATSSQVLDIYAGLFGRTILRPGALPELASLTLPDLADTNRAIVSIEDQLKQIHLSVVRDGNKFMWILPDDWRNSPLVAQLNRLQSPASEDSTNAGYSYNLQGVDLDQALEIFAYLRGRTILRPILHSAPFNLKTQSSLTRSEASHAFGVVLAMNGIATVDDGNKFVWILPADWRNSAMAAQLDRLQLLPADVSTNSEYSYNFQGLDLNQTLEIYADLCARTLLRPMLPSNPIYLRTTTTLTRNEAIHAFHVVLAMNGIATVDDGDKFVRVVSFNQLSQVQASAPKTELGAALIDPGQIQKSLRDTNADPRNQRPGMSDATPPITAYHLVEYYAELSNQKAQPPKQMFQTPIFFKIVTPLSKPELLYAITTTLALNHFKIVPGDRDTITLEQITPSKKRFGD